MAATVFEHMGFMLDVSRHYMPPEEIRKLLDAAAVLKLNRMHWHLTDDQGWRVEIRKYPYLTKTGSVRGDSCFGGTPAGERNSGYYTQTEIRDLVSYAASLGIDIIPEIEIPGHASAMLASYPEFGCLDRNGKRWENRVEISDGIFPALICAGSDRTLDFLKDVLDEIISLFPFPMIHIGGDEALKIRWRRCPDCQRRMSEQDLPSEDALQRWLLLQVGEYLAGKGRCTIVWNDVLAGGLLPVDTFIVQQWLGGEDRTRAFMESGGSVIRSDLAHFYFDYPYGSIDVRHIYNTSRIPQYALGYEDRLLGVECPLWTERVADLDRAAYLLFPRLAAVASRMNEEERPWEAFRSRVAELETKIGQATGLHGAPETLWDLSPEEAAAERDAEEERTRIINAPDSVLAPDLLNQVENAERLALSLGIARDFVLKGGDAVLAKLYRHPATESTDGAEQLISQLMTAADSRRWGEWKRIPEDIWIETMKCFPRFISEHRRSYGRDGFDRYGWTVRQISARLFRIGELEYELITKESGGREVGLHIPSDADMDPAKLNDSLAKAGAFLREYFPEWADAPRTCESWLLSPVLKDLLPSSSRILRFRNAFDLTGTEPEDDSALEWVFHIAEGQRPVKDYSRLPEDTSLQRSMKSLLLRGSKPGSASGILARPF